MPETLLQTKLFKPTLRPTQVIRSHLIKKLNRGLSGKVSLVSAPAGFGKTTLVADWLAQLERPFGWLSLDVEDNDPNRFFSYLDAALQSVSGTNETSLFAPNLPLKAMTTLLLNNLVQMPKSGVLVLDDFHLIATESILEAIAFLSERLPHTLHLVLVTRSDPPLPLAKMRARGELNEVREKDLRFTKKETAVFLNQMMGLNLTVQNIAALEARTEGWIASLQLAALSLRDANDTTQLISSFSGTHHYIVDYLVEEVLAQRPPGTREFLLKTSILNRFSAPLCDTLLSNKQSQQTLEQLEEANFFLIPLDNERHWYRYHHLFADVLRQHAAQIYSGQLPGLYRQAAKWFEAHKFLYDAIEMALAGSKYDYAATLILQVAETTLWEQGEWLLLEKWIAILPESLVKSRPRLYLYHTWGCLIRGQLEVFNARLANAEDAIQNDPDKNQLVHGELAAMRATMARFQGNHPEVIAQAGVALSYLPSGDNRWRVMTLINLGAAHFLGDNQQAAQDALAEVWRLAKAENQAIWGAVSGSFLAQLQMRNGRYHEALHLYQQAQTVASSKQESIFNIGMTHVGMGQIWLAWNNLDKAEDALQQAWDISTAVQNTLLILSASLALAQLRQIQGEREAAKSLILQAQDIAQKSAATWSWVHVPLQAHLSRAWLKQDNFDEASRLLEAAFANYENQSGFWLESLRIAQARLLMAEERWSNTESLLATLWQTTLAHQRIQSQIEIRLLQAITQHHLRQPDQAENYLKDALSLARPSGNIRLFLDEGALMQQLIGTLQIEDKAVQTYVQKIAKSFPAQLGSQSEHANQQLVEPLTARELELLTLVTTGATNREIAEQLFISYGTVRRHLNNIYGKLAVNGRSQAILKAQTLNLV